jgi:hypothetical protein
MRRAQSALLCYATRPDPEGLQQLSSHSQYQSPSNMNACLALYLNNRNQSNSYPIRQSDTVPGQ